MRPPVELEATILSGFPVLAQGVDSSVYCLDHALGPFCPAPRTACATRLVAHLAHRHLPYTQQLLEVWYNQLSLSQLVSTIIKHLIHIYISTSHHWFLLVIVPYLLLFTTVPRAGPSTLKHFHATQRGSSAAPRGTRSTAPFWDRRVQRHHSQIHWWWM